MNQRKIKNWLLKFYDMERRVKRAMAREERKMKNRVRRRCRFNVYGYWEFTDTLGLGHVIEEGDIVYVFSKCEDMVSAYTVSGKVVKFHVSNLTKGFFERPGRGHPVAKCTEKEEIGFYAQVGCPDCDIYKAKNKLRKVLKRRGVIK